MKRIVKSGDFIDAVVFYNDDYTWCVTEDLIRDIDDMVENINSMIIEECIKHEIQDIPVIKVSTNLFYDDEKYVCLIINYNNFYLSYFLTSIIIDAGCYYCSELNSNVDESILDLLNNNFKFENPSSRIQSYYMEKQ